MSLTEETVAPDALGAAITRHEPEPAPGAAERYAALYARRMESGAEGAAIELERLGAEAAGALGLVARRRGPIAVRAFTPDLAVDGYSAVGSVLETDCVDLPFLVDSVLALLQDRGYATRHVVHPILGTARAEDGALLDILHPRDAPVRESLMHVELDLRLDPAALAGLEDDVRDVLAQVARVVEDHEAMRGRLRDMQQVIRDAGEHAGADPEGTIAFLQWLDEDHFVFLGAREYAVGDGSLHAVPDSGLGVMAQVSSSGPAEVQTHAPDAELLGVGKTNRISAVHRRERMDDLAVRRLDADGRLAGVSRLVGLFTTRAYSEPAAETPLLARKLERIVEQEDLIEGSHDHKAAVALFNAFPKDELFNATAEQLRTAVVALLALHGDEVRVLLRDNDDARTASLIVSLPRAADDQGLRDRLHELIVDRFGTDGVEVHEVLERADRVQLHVGIHGERALHDVAPAALEDAVRLLARTWPDALADVLVDRLGPAGAERARILAARWAPRLTAAYQAATDPYLGADDVLAVEALVDGEEDFGVGLQDVPATHRGAAHTRVAFYRRGPKVELSAANALLEHLGLRVIEEVAHRLRAVDELWIQGFVVLGPHDRPLDLDVCGERVAEALVRAQAGEVESDGLDRLVVSGGLTYRQVDVLRAYRRYRQRLGSRYPESFQNDVITAHPELTAKLVALFEARFDPEGPADRAVEQALREEVTAELDQIASLDHDRILRNQLGLIEATVRTNVFRPDRGAMAFKLRSADVPAMPQPAPLFEIFVSSPHVEGIHLRGGRIARGGLRWSDRMDYRTEVFGLLRAQMTKNAIIVPTGAKGGFLLRRPPADPAALKAEVHTQYVAYINALLDVTDDLDGDTVVHPDGVRVLDEDDTYLVVAADKGTATFSDTANEVAVRRGFWLGDAFASGGSTGYDHKALGITARGTWESVRRHGRDLGLDVDREAMTVVGIGDMSGDVFGNGMLLSEHLRLVAAYDHRHIFLDPDPGDAAACHAERRRLFDLAGSSWDDYDRALISEGGGVFPRTAKSIPVSEAVRRALGVEATRLSPTELIRTTLRAPVDLLFNGGIGTVVKASTESDAEALDRSSDQIRVDGRDLRCRIVGEGGNLGFTQRARIEAARNGVLINADFVDNSAGVDCSDHEVNLKILLDLAVRRSELEPPERDRLLAEMTDDVVDHVLRDSFWQAQILAQQVQGSAARLDAYENLMEALEELPEGWTTVLHRADEALPAPDELAERRRGGEGLTRPELAVLVAYAKRSLTEALLQGDLPDDPWWTRDLRAYFPPRIVERFGGLVAEHPLRRELVATIAANDVVNGLGPAWAAELQAERGATSEEVVRAYRIAKEATDAERRWEAIEALGTSIDQETTWRLMGCVDRLVEGTARWHLSHSGAGMDGTVGLHATGLAQLAEVVAGLRSDAWREEHDRIVAELVERGVPEQIARAHALQPALVHAPDVVAVSQATGVGVPEVARAFFAVGDGLRLEWLEREVDDLPASSRLQRWAVNAVRDDVLAARALLAHRALQEGRDRDPDEAVAAFLDQRGVLRGRLTTFTRALSRQGDADLAGLTLAARQLRALAS